MTKTIKEIEEIQDIIGFICSKYQINNIDDKLVKLYEIINKMLYYENELAEKDKLIASAESRIESAYENILIEKDNELAEKDKEIKRLIEDSKFDIKIGKDLLNEIKQLKQQLDMAHNFNQNLGIEIEELKKQQLYKEDFDVADFCINCRTELFYIDNIKKRKLNKNEKCSTCGWDKIIKLKDNSKYDTLPSKEELK